MIGTRMPLKCQCCRPAMVFGAISPQFLAEMDYCVHCTVHNTNRHMLKSFAQPGSQLKKICHTKLYIQISEVSENKKLKVKGFRVILADFKQILLLYCKTVGPGQLR